MQHIHMERSYGLKNNNNQKHEKAETAEIENKKEIDKNLSNNNPFTHHPEVHKYTIPKCSECNEDHTNN